MKHFKKFLIVTLLFSTSLTLAQSKKKKPRPKLLKYKTYSCRQQSKRDFLEKELKFSQKDLKGKYITKSLNLKKFNPKTYNKKMLRKCEKVSIVIPKGTSFAKKRACIKVCQKSSRNQKKKRTASHKKHKNQWSIFYMASMGSIEQKDPDTTKNSDLDQNSPYTLGGFWGRKLASNKKIGVSFYISKLDDVLDENNKELSIPTEYALNTEYSHQFAVLPFWTDLKLEYERISTFNTEELEGGQALDTQTHNLLFLGFGFTKKTTLFGKTTLFKGSWAHTVYSKRNDPNRTNDEEYTGYKLLFYTRLYPEFSFLRRGYFHLLYKLHKLESPVELIISRWGLGFGLDF